jgi:methylenetetrahydrofolate reductase (NADPH)
MAAQSSPGPDGSPDSTVGGVVDSGAVRSIAERLRSGEQSFSFEFFPPKDEAGEGQLWRAIEALEPYRPTFVSVTYGAGGATRGTTVRVTGRIARETSLTPMAHLTCVGHTVPEIEAVLDSYAGAGVANVMLLRGDPHEGPRAPWTPTPGGLTHAAELVELVKGRGGFDIGVAAFPEGHPTAASLDADADVLAAKARAGAQFAITQMFFRAEDYFGLVERVRRRGVDLPILPGIMPILNLAAIRRQGELIGTSVPADVVARIERHEDPQAIRAEGIAIAAELCERLLDGGAPGLHFYTLNRSTATLEIFDRLNVRV